MTGREEQGRAPQPFLQMGNSNILSFVPRSGGHSLNLGDVHWARARGQAGVQARVQHSNSIKNQSVLGRCVLACRQHLSLVCFLLRMSYRFSFCMPKGIFWECLNSCFLNILLQWNSRSKAVFQGPLPTALWASGFSLQSYFQLKPFICLCFHRQKCILHLLCPICF